MKIITRERLFQKSKLGLFLFFLIGLFVFYLFNSGLVEFFTVKHNTADWAHLSSEEARARAWEIVVSSIDLSTYTFLSNYTSTIGVVLNFAVALFFYREKTGFFQFQFTRKQSKKKVVYKALLQYSFISAVGFYLCYLIYFQIGYLIIGPKLGFSSRDIFDGVFGAQFANYHTYLYYLLEGFYMYFLAPFVHTFFACSVALSARKAYQSVLIPAAYYFAVSVAIAPLKGVIKYFQPPYVLGFSAFVYLDSSPLIALRPLLALVPLIIPSLVLIIVYLRRDQVES